jgi:hypothetical protein
MPAALLGDSKIMDIFDGAARPSRAQRAAIREQAKAFEALKNQQAEAGGSADSSYLSTALQMAAPRPRATFKKTDEQTSLPQSRPGKVQPAQANIKKPLVRKDEKPIESSDDEPLLAKSTQGVKVQRRFAKCRRQDNAKDLKQGGEVTKHDTVLDYAHLTSPNLRTTRRSANRRIVSDDDEDEDISQPPPKRRLVRRRIISDDEEDEQDELKPAPTKRRPKLSNANKTKDHDRSTLCQATGARQEQLTTKARRSTDSSGDDKTAADKLAEKKAKSRELAQKSRLAREQERRDASQEMEVKEARRAEVAQYQAAGKRKRVSDSDDETSSQKKGRNHSSSMPLALQGRQSTAINATNGQRKSEKKGENLALPKVNKASDATGAVGFFKSLTQGWFNSAQKREAVGKRSTSLVFEQCH